MSNREVPFSSTHCEEEVGLKVSKFRLISCPGEKACVGVAISTESEQVPLQASYDQTLRREGQALHVIPSPGQAHNRACLSDKPGKQTCIPEPQLSAAAPSVMGLKQNSPHQT